MTFHPGPEKGFSSGQRAFDRKVAEGKHKLSVLNVVRAKIVERMFAVIRDDRKYERQYRYEVTA